ncbi:hypothetical protein D1007_51875 [Hordeum vulgare]|nr:hypothetical protein D1007_51875 [Hordeum vulgare]
MGDGRPARAERRATRIAKTAHVGAFGTRHSPSPVVNAATGPEVQEQQCSSHPATGKDDGCTATLSLVRPSGSVSRARAKMPHSLRAVSMATELLRYGPARDRHDD